jgi:hypothetical protein
MFGRHSLILSSMMLLMSSCAESADNDYFKPVPGSYIMVDTADIDKPSFILQNVQKMLMASPQFSKKMMTHGPYPPTSYNFKFKGRCDKEKALVAAVRVEIRKTTNALIICTDTPPDVEYGVPPNLPGK